MGGVSRNVMMVVNTYRDGNADKHFYRLSDINRCDLLFRRGSRGLWLAAAQPALV